VSPVLGGNYQLAFTGACYYQGGHDKGGLKLNACMIKLAASYIPGEKSYTAG